MRKADFEMSSGHYRHKLQALLTKWTMIRHSFRKTLKLSFDHYRALAFLERLRNHSIILAPFGSFEAVLKSEKGLVDLPECISIQIRKPKGLCSSQSPIHIIADFQHLYVFHKCMETTLSKSPFLVVQMAINGERWQVEVVRLSRKHRNLLVLQDPNLPEDGWKKAG